MSLSGKAVVTLRDVKIGEGRPKICVPIVGKTESEILASADQVKQLKADIIEWRVDFLDEVEEIERVKAILVKLRSSLENIPILFTFRSQVEGGEKEISEEYYACLNQEIAKTGNVDLVDIELFTRNVKGLVNKIHESGVNVIMSNHDFMKTPESEELKNRFLKMKEFGADIVKIAVMPQTTEDVIRLLSVTEEMNRNKIGCPIVSMSMTGLGLISRIAGEVFGSTLTFGTAGKASAPGQLPVEDLNMILSILHDKMI